jgi:hypothetical protein
MRAEIMMMGRCTLGKVRRISTITSKPLTPGIMQSSSTRSGQASQVRRYSSDSLPDMAHWTCGCVQEET